MRAWTSHQRRTSHASHTRSGEKPSAIGSTAQPVDSRRARPAAHAARMPSSNARWPPRSPSQPIRGRAGRSSGSSARRAANDGSLASESGARASWPAWTSSRSARSRDVARHRPFGARSASPRRRAPAPPGRGPALGLKPKTLFHAAGLRRLPIESLPSATGSIRSAIATAAPPLLPPADLRRVVGVAGRAEHLVEGVRAEPELGRVGLADDDASGRLHSLRRGARRRPERSRAAAASRASFAAPRSRPCP